MESWIKKDIMYVGGGVIGIAVVQVRDISFPSISEQVSESIDLIAQ